MNELPSPLGDRVSRVVRELGASVSKEAEQAITTWIALVASWNTRIDLTAARSEDELVDLMVADALLLAPRLAVNATVVDVGTGAGAPGMPLALARPDLAVTLIEPLQKRIAFLRTVVGSLPPTAPRPTVVRGRGEDLVRRGAHFDVAISRATLAPPAWLDLGAALVGGKGEVWVLLARDAPPERAGFVIADDLRYRWPLTGAERRAVKLSPRIG